MSYLNNISSQFLDDSIEFLEQEILRFDPSRLTLHYKLHNSQNVERYQVAWNHDLKHVYIDMFVKNPDDSVSIIDMGSNLYKSEHQLRQKLDLLVMTLYTCLIRNYFDAEFAVGKTISTKTISKFVNDHLKRRFDAYHTTLSYYLKDKHDLSPELRYKKKALFSSQSINDLLDILATNGYLSVEDGHQRLVEHFQTMTLKAHHGQDVMNFKHEIEALISLTDFKLSISGQAFAAICHLKAASLNAYKSHTESHIGSLAFLDRHIKETDKFDLTKPLKVRYVTASTFIVPDENLERGVTTNNNRSVSTMSIEMLDSTDAFNRYVKLTMKSREVDLKHLSTLEPYFEAASHVYRQLYHLQASS